MLKEGVGVMIIKKDGLYHSFRKEKRGRGNKYNVYEQRKREEREG